MYRTIVRRAGVNPLTGKKQYKVAYSFSLGSLIGAVFEEDKDVWIWRYWAEYTVMVLPTDKLYQTGTFINPRKALGL